MHVKWWEKLSSVPTFRKLNNQLFRCRLWSTIPNQIRWRQTRLNKMMLGQRTISSGTSCRGRMGVKWMHSFGSVNWNKVLIVRRACCMTVLGVVRGICHRNKMKRCLAKTSDIKRANLENSPKSGWWIWSPNDLTARNLDCHSGANWSNRSPTTFVWFIRQIQIPVKT